MSAVVTASRPEESHPEMMLRQLGRLPRRTRLARIARYGTLAWILVSVGCQTPSARSTELAAGAQRQDQPTRIVLLGTGTPGAEPDRSGPATAIVVGGNAYLVDFGPGIVRQASAAARTKGVLPLRVQNLRTAFLTHLHSDHTTGYPDLILTPWVLGRREPLRVYGPTGLQAMTDSVIQAYAADIRVRTEGPERLPSVGGTVDVYEINEGVVHEDDLVTVEAFAVPHGTWDQAFGYKFTTSDRVIVISGDTGPFEQLAEIARGADVLVHEAYGTAGFNRRAPETQRYHGTFHTSATQVGEIAEAAGVGMVILYHQLHLAGGSPEDMVEEVRTSFGGPVFYGRDLDVY